MLKYYPDVAILSQHYSTKLDLSKQIENRVFFLKSIENFESYIKEHNTFIIIYEVTKESLCFLHRIITTINSHKQKRIKLIVIGDYTQSIEFFKQIKSCIIDSPLFLLFSSAHTLLKSIKLASEQLFESELAHVMEHEKDRVNFITLKSEGKKLILLENSIQYIVKNGKTSADIYLEDKTILTSSSSLKEIVSLSSPFLFQCHKSYLVNVKFINSISSNQWDGYEIILNDNINLPLSKGFFQNFKMANDLLKSSLIMRQIQSLKSRR